MRKLVFSHAEIVKRYMAGAYASEIAERYQVPTERIREVLAANGVAMERRQTKVARPLIERILESVDVQDDGCWLWSRSLNRGGYGRTGGSGEGSRLTHRYVWEFYNGPVAEGLDLDHLCRIRACCNPDHLEPVTRTENVRRGLKYRPTACPKGHAYTPENSMLTKVGHLKCRACDRQWSREKYRRSAAAKSKGA